MLGSSLALVFVTFAGYALAMSAWARLAPRPVRRADFTPPVAVVIVVHDGAARIRDKIGTCLAQDYPPDRLRVLVVSDGSGDATAQVVREHPDPRVRVLEFRERRGKAACLNDALAACTEEFVFLTDLRQRLHPLALRRLLACLADPEVGAAGGELVFEREAMTAYGAGLDAYWRLERRLRHDESAWHSSVGVSGAVYALRRECFRPIPPDTILDDVLIPMSIVAGGRRVVYAPGAEAYDRPSGDPGAERRRKVRTLAGNFQLLARHPAWCLPGGHPLWLAYLCHKVLRLFAPIALLAAFASAAALAPESPAAAALFAAQALAWGLALLGATWGPASRLAPVRLCLTFASLNAFVVLGFLEFVSNPRAHLWGAAREAATGRAPGGRP